jgi:Mandelate racemase / muconate lactonizing enzyme, N-terminal domain
MRRREFLKSVPPVVLIPQLRSAPRLKITQIRIINLKVVHETGKMEAAWDPGTVTTHRVAGGSAIEIHTDQGLSGIGPAIDGSALEPAKARLVGMDPFAIEQLAGPLRYYLGHSPRTVSSLEIALWDLIGKAAGQPLYKLWGAAKDRVPAYASMIQLSTPEERVRMALQLKSQGWKAIKLRAHYQTLKEDMRLVEEVRKAVGDVLFEHPAVFVHPAVVLSASDRNAHQAVQLGQFVEGVAQAWFFQPDAVQPLQFSSGLQCAAEVPPYTGLPRAEGLRLVGVNHDLHVYSQTRTLGQV